MSVKKDSTAQLFFCSISVKTSYEATNIQFHTVVFNLLPSLYLRLWNTIKIYWCIYVVVNSYYIFFFIFGGMTMYGNGLKP